MAVKTIHDSRYTKLIDELIKIRHNSGWSQRMFERKAKFTHTFVARTELCERRLDIIETIDYLKALGLSKAEILKVLEKII